MARRSRAREVVLQILFEEDLNPDRKMDVADRFLANRLRHDDGLVEFAKMLLSGVRRNREELNNILSARAQNWSLDRMAIIDRNVLRLGAFEMLYTETPHRVVINEAVEMAKRYGAEHSGKFVNGILDRLLQDLGQGET